MTVYVYDAYEPESVCEECGAHYYYDTHAEEARLQVNNWARGIAAAASASLARDERDDLLREIGRLKMKLNRIKAVVLGDYDM